MTAGEALLGMTAGEALFGMTAGEALLGMTAGEALFGMTAGEALLGMTAGGTPTRDRRERATRDYATRETWALTMRQPRSGKRTQTWD
jgi:hypothetical protein